MSADTEGYTCVMDADVGAWIIVNRFGAAVPGHPPFETYLGARRQADKLNSAVFARRFA